MLEQIRYLAQELNEGLERTPEEMEKCVQWLMEYYTANQISYKQLRELCWEDSDWVFQQIFD
jgi:hypothetical protein